MAACLRLFERDVFPWIGGRPVSEITAQDILGVMRRIESRGALETAHRATGQMRTWCSAMRSRPVDVSATHPATCAAHCPLSGASTLRPRPTRQSSLGSCARWMAYEGDLAVQCALRLAPLRVCAPGRAAPRLSGQDIDLDAAEWRYRVTKTDVPITSFPSARQAVEILRELQPLTGIWALCLSRCSHQLSGPMSDNAVLAAMRRMGIGKEEMTGHGFRAVARTILDEVLGVRPDLIEHQLAHAVRDPNGRAYNRTAHLPERRKMMQQWADYLGTLKSNGTRFQQAQP